jgi:hypothetical protein
MEKITLSTISKIAAAIALSFVIGTINVKPARAGLLLCASGQLFTAPEPTYYYAPQTVYGEPPPPSQGITLFFGLP